MTAAEKRLDEEESKVRKTKKSRHPSHKATKKNCDEKLPRLSAESQNLASLPEASFDASREFTADGRHTSKTAILNELVVLENEAEREGGLVANFDREEEEVEFTYESLSDEDTNDVSERYERLEKLAQAATTRMRESLNRASEKYGEYLTTHTDGEPVSNAAFMTAVETDSATDSKPPSKLDRDMKELVRDMSDLLERVTSGKKELLELESRQEKKSM